MKTIYGVLTLSILISSLCYASEQEKIDTSRLTLVEENHAKIKKDNATYILDSYIIPFQQPYYVTIYRDDHKSISLDEASKIAIEYIEPRGCTDPLSRRTDLDRHNNDYTQWLIGIEC